MFINLTNHPSSGWSEEQLKAAEAYGEIRDITFPQVDEKASESEIKSLADNYVTEILSMGEAQDIVVHIMGEQTFCYALIAKLQKKGVRCLASCTKHDSYTNEKGEKVSNFHFTRFREYAPPRALRWWIRIKKKISALFNCRPFKEKNFYSWTAIMIILLCETCIIAYHQTECLCVETIAYVLVCILIALFLVSRIVGFKFYPRSTIISNLLANAITPSMLGTLYLLTFVIHIGWAANAVLGLYTEFDENFMPVLDSTLVCAIGLLTVIVFFPDGRENKNDNAKLVFVTGISSFKDASSAKEDEKAPIYEIFNMRPLIRILQLVAENKKYKMMHAEFLILQTSELASFTPTPFFSEYEDFAFDTFDAQECEKYGVVPEDSIHDKLRLIIKKLAIKEFRELEDWVKHNLDIRFTVPCDYNNFPKCFETLSKEVQSLDNQNHRLIFNTTPGTAVVSTVMALLSIDGDRELYYYSQDRNIPEDRVAERLQKADKQGIQLEALLSQALEKISASK